MPSAADKPLSSFSPACGDFVPRRLYRGGHRQTIICHLLPRTDGLRQSERRLFQVEPTVQVLCRCNWQPERERALTLVLVHGLEGSSESQYMIGSANKAWAAGMNVVRMNVRNCGGTERLGPTLYHSGMSADIGEVVRALIAEDGLERIALAGFSMGGNQVLKLAGEWGRDRSTPAAVRAIAAVSPAMDLAPSADALHLPANRLYEWRFLLGLRGRLRRKMALYPAQYRVSKFWWRSIREFDDCVTAPHCGFADADDYYEQASSARVLQHIGVPTLIVHAKDDPFIRLAESTRAKLAANPAIRFIETEYGGHCGFLAAADAYDGRWAERLLVEFVQHFA